MENKYSVVTMERIEISQTMSFTLDNEEVPSGGGILPESTQPSDKVEKIPMPKNDHEQRSGGEGAGGAGDSRQLSPTESENSTSASEMEAENVHPPDVNMDEVSTSGESDTDDEVPSPSSSTSHSTRNNDATCPDDESSEQREDTVPQSLNVDASADQPNYLEFRLPKSTDNQKYSERTVAEGNEIVEILKNFRSQLESKPDVSVKVQGPPQLQVRLFDHQQHGLAWMLWREDCTPAGGILADDMGLGKTVTTIALIIKSLEDQRRQASGDNRLNPGGTLIVCPANLIGQWKEELQSKGNITEVWIFHGQEERDISILSKYKVVITSYETLANNFTSQDKILFRIHWNRVVLDEAQYIRNPNARRSLCVAGLKADKCWALTGSPIQNHVKDIFPILRFLKIKPFDDIRAFNKWIANGDAVGVARLHSMMECWMLRRTKDALVADGLMPELPRKTNHLIVIDLSPEERLVYDKVLNYSKILCSLFLHQTREQERQLALGPDYMSNGNFQAFQLTPAQMVFVLRREDLASHHILTLILRMRQICCHPALTTDMLEREDFEGAGVDNPADNVLNEANREMLGDLAEFHGEIGAEERVADRHVLTRDNPVFNESIKSSKMTAIMELVQEIIKKGEKVIIGSDFVRYLNLIGQHLELIPDATYEVYSGAINHDERARIAHRFNESNETMILLLSLGAAGQGLDLKAANHFIIADIHWNTQLEINGQNAIYRIGQTRDVFIHKFVCKDTIEQTMLALQKRKLMTAGIVLSGSGHGVRQLDHGEMGELFNV